MRYQVFGRRSGLRVSEYVLGTANFGLAKTTAGKDGAKAIFETFTQAGGTTFDVSNIYQNGQAESILGELLGPDRDDFVVITKYSGTRQADVRQGTTGNSRKTMIRALEASLRRLNTDYVDVFMPHFPDGVTPIAEILAGFEDLIRAGKIRYGGLSNFPAWRVAGAATRADLSSSASLAGIQVEYSLAELRPNENYCPWPKLTDWASWPTRRWPAGCSPASTVAANRVASRLAVAIRRAQQLWTRLSPSPMNSPLMLPRLRWPGCVDAQPRRKPPSSRSPARAPWRSWKRTFRPWTSNSATSTTGG